MAHLPSSSWTNSRKIRTKNGVIYRIFVHLEKIEELYVAIFLNRLEIPAFGTIPSQIRTKNAANGDEPAWLRIIST
ncbi:hypothetical protein J1TS5_39000 [Paenibacillus macerans]|nr:hypothetical protein J1TS5_39000 [Paenibacillus macerans]